ncbi:putative prophage CPS-53 integrase [Pseudovibrio sp. Ad5]|uniref:Arm DNA-binding domain-containing protein n=1 Tax=Pseudovibrio sp. Ad5 TaxID=989436 RepID=UPI0007B2A90E|nr:Arm DNA-binding domain-containing protein [Pseudovibrio sp. Ad5]KZK96596.1 putative prophage CPS-53 integrase [Pseudovibrio sp. Ad5]
MPNVTKRTVDAAKPTAKKYFVWDGKLSGFGLQVAPTGRKTFIVQYRTLEGRSRRLTLGKYGELTPDQARGQAVDVLAKVRIGEDPTVNRKIIRNAPTVDDLLDMYLSEHVEVHNNPKSAVEIRRILERCVRKPLGMRNWLQLHGRISPNYIAPCAELRDKQTMCWQSSPKRSIWLKYGA